MKFSKSKKKMEYITFSRKFPAKKIKKGKKKVKQRVTLVSYDTATNHNNLVSLAAL